MSENQLGFDNSQSVTTSSYSSLQFNEAFNDCTLFSKSMRSIELMESEAVVGMLGRLGHSKVVLEQGSCKPRREDIIRLTVDLFAGYSSDRQVGMEAMKEHLMVYIAARNDLTVGALRAAVTKVHLECKFTPSIAEFFEKLEEAEASVKVRLKLYSEWVRMCQDLLKERGVY
ncbi:hypothetical protein SAMN04488518_113145 [Pseudovibrio ascidiaceicola]|uniref:Uncharacterized protein n=1 Tax=Pseudovibrio ascidiaceicola TaxID=285279 RepID=A0A1I4E3F7_9HYPH|nr:hypothetical protein [Pseudovibrio ascidiaceicola]SFK99793.1 hypothetical protein SAMN04488518_113145 [Pseudovibrio ascidiaceicola]